jgi:hypothetical protein
MTIRPCILTWCYVSRSWWYDYFKLGLELHCLCNPNHYMLQFEYLHCLLMSLPLNLTPWHARMCNQHACLYATNFDQIFLSSLFLEFELSIAFKRLMQVPPTKMWLWINFCPSWMSDIFPLHASNTTAGDSVVPVNQNLADFCLAVMVDPKERHYECRC